MAIFWLSIVSYMQELKQKTHNALRWSEKYTKTDMIYLARGGFWSVTSQIILSISAFLLAIAFAHFASKEVYGEYKYILSLASILATFSLSGLGSSLIRSITLGYEGTLQYAFWKNIKWSIFVFTASLCVAVYYFLNDNLSLALAMLVVGSLSPIISSTNLYNSLLIAKKDFRRSAIYFMIIGNLFPAACLLFVMSMTSSPLWLVATYFGSNALIGVFLYKRIVSIYKPNKLIDDKSLMYAKHVSLINILTGIANNIDQILVFHYIGAAQLAIYNFAIAIPNQTKGPLRSIGTLMFPKFVERPENEIRAGMKYKFISLFFFGLAMAIVYIIIAPYIYKFLFPKYLDSVLYSQIFSISLIAITFNPADIYLAAKKKVREQYINNVVTAVFQIIATSVGVIFYGLIGLIVARVISRVASSLISLTLYQYAIRNTTENPHE